MNKNILNDFNKICSVSELLEIHVKDNGEKLVSLCDILKDSALFIIPSYLKGNDDLQNTCFLAREGVAQKLNEICKKISTINKNAKLLISNVYRPPKVQEENFKITLEKIKKIYPLFSEIEQIQKAHEMIAFPKVAGHVTGGAIDLSLIINEKSFDMGGEIGDFENEELLTINSSRITKEQFENRMILRKLMCSYGFAPYNGEWWHFSYGDREWAAIYNKKFAIYDAINI